MDAPTTHYVLTGLLTIIAYFLKAENVAKAKAIEELFSKHRELDNSITSHKLELAKNYYDSDKLDLRFDKFDATLEKIANRLEAIASCPQVTKV